ncbi:MAG: ABC transporter ATP-binding protein, partial [Candidatus Heimdallarchaeota archaeon]|nr:ABC transporter ATP-binding protein [Candidatus Heimdallarchaeota archaeon]
MATKEAKNKIIEYNDHKPLVLATEKYKSANQWFWSGLVRYPGLMFTSMFIIILNAVISVLPGILLGLALDILAAGDDYLVAVVGSIAGAALLSWLTASLSAYLWSLSSYRFERDIRQEFFDVVQNHSMAFHDEHDSGVLLSMGMGETNQSRCAFTPSLRHLINSMLSIIVVCIYFFIRIPIGTKIIGVADWRIGIGIVSSFIIYLVLAWIYARRIGPIRKELATELGNVSSSSQETFRGIEVVRSFDSEEIEEAKFEKQSLRLADKTKQEGFLSAFYWPALIMVLFTAISFGIGLWMVSKNDGSMSIGQITSMLTLLIQLVILNFMVPMRLLGLQAGRMNAKR